MFFSGTFVMPIRQRTVASMITAIVIILSILPRPRCAEVEEALPLSRAAMPELLIGVGTRAAGMGGTSAGIIDDLSSLYWNPAGLNRLRHTEIEFIHNSWIQDVSRETLLFGLPLNFMFSGLSGSAAAVGINYFDLGSIDITGESPDGGIIFNHEVLDLFMLGAQAGLGFTLSPALAVGGAFKFAYQDLGAKSFIGLGLDIGLQYYGIKNVDLGIALGNLGFSLDGYGLPQTLRLGGAYNIEPAPGHKIIAGADAEMSMLAVRPGPYHFGVEYQHNETAALRLGYRFSDDDSSACGSGLSMGMGIKIGGWKFGYAFASQGDWGDAHRISAGLDFQKSAKVILEKKESFEAAEKPPAPVLSWSRIKDAVYPEIQDISISREEMAMQKLLQENIRIKVDVKEHPAGGIREVVFRARRVSGPRIIRWELHLADQSGKPLRKYAGKDLPRILRWDGKTEDGEAAASASAGSLRYRLVLRDVKGGQEVRTGKLLASQCRGQVRKSGEKKHLVGQKIFGPVPFKTGRAEITPLGAECISEAAGFIRKYPRAKILVEGFCDQEEADQAITLSKARAQAVARYLTAYHNISLSRILVRGRKEKESGDSGQEGQSRSVIITVEGRKQPGTGSK